MYTFLHNDVFNSFQPLHQKLCPLRYPLRSTSEYGLHTEFNNKTRNTMHNTLNNNTCYFSVYFTMIAVQNIGLSGSMWLYHHLIIARMRLNCTPAGQNKTFVMEKIANAIQQEIALCQFRYISNPIWHISVLSSQDLSTPLPNDSHTATLHDTFSENKNCYCHIDLTQMARRMLFCRHPKYYW